jgi:hypothetical protein
MTTPPSTTTTTITRPLEETPRLPTTGGDRALGFVALWVASLGGVILAVRRRLLTSR